MTYQTMIKSLEKQMESIKNQYVKIIESEKH